MRRISLPLGRGAFFLCAFLFALAALLPLRLVLGWLSLDRAGVAAREAEGSVWLGALRETRIGGAVVGDLRARLDPLPLLVGRAHMRLDRIDHGGDGAPFRGAISVSRHSAGVDGVTALVPLAPAFAPLPIVSLDLTDVSVRFQDGLCERADGLVKAAVAGDIAGIALPGGLSGNARCDAGMLLLPLVSQGGGEMLSLSIQRAGTYRAELLMRPSDAATRVRLLAAGFAPAGDRLRLAIQGSL